jgi:hypothetical protein
MKSNNITIEKPYIITYSNHLFFEGKRIAFRKRELFIIDNIPIHVKRSEQGWWFGKKLLTPKTAEEIIIKKPINIDVTDLQWYQQEELNHVFNLNKN